MRFSLCAAIFLAVSTISVAASTCAASQPKNESTLLQLEQSWAKALEQHDSTTVSCILSDEFEDVDVNGQLHHRAETLARIPRRSPSQNHLEDLKAHVFGDFAYVRGLNKVTDPSGKPVAQVRFTDVFVYRDGRWQAVAGHETLRTSENK